MEILTLILATVLIVVLYLCMHQRHRVRLCRPTPPVSATSNVTLIKTSAAQQCIASSQKQETEWQPKNKWSTLNVSLNYLDGENQDCVSTSVLTPKDTVAEAKQKLAIEGQQLIFAGKPLDNARTLEDCGINDGARLYTTSPELVAFQVRSITGRSLALRCNAQDRVATVRLKVETVLGIEGRHMTLVLRGQELKSSTTLRESGLRDGDVVHLVMRFWGGDDIAGRITAQSLPPPIGEAWGDIVIEQAMRTLHLAHIKNNITRGETSNVEGIVHVERNVLEGFRFQMARSTVVVVVFLLGEPYLLQLECSWSADQAMDVLQRALGISVPQKLKFYLCEKELENFYGLKDGDFLELY